jgi:alkylation response protein AidB-like acyl-CoA dehydrogenase
VAQSEKRGEPVLWGGAVTEPNAGTDIWDEDFLKVARIMTFAKKVPGGYRLTGRKCFISNGSVAKWIVVAAALDPKHLLESWTVFIVRADSPGFSVGRVEKKMGQKASPAAELIFEDVFVPEELRVGEEGSGGRNVSIYLAGSRGPVGAIGTGCARRALECLVDWAKQHKTGRGRLIDQQALQLTLARMASEIEQARQAYVAAALACDEIFSDILGHPLTRITLTGLPGAAIRHPYGQAALKSRPVQAILNWIRDGAIPDDRLAQVSCLATIAKCKGSDVGVRVAGEAMRIVGHDSLDPRWPVEKCYRDAKLTQIYEGTNEANTITLFKDMARTWRA